MKKYILTDEKKDFLGTTLYRIQAVRSFGNVKEGEKGGWIEKEKNLSHDGNCWISGTAWVFDNARACGDARVFGDARIFSSAVVEKTQDFICFSSIGSRFDSATFYKNKNNGISVCCGCFSGTIEEFQKRVTETHGSNKFAREYNMAIELAKIHILEGKNE